MSGTRIASISGLRGVVGDGLDPAVVVEFAAAYASGCDRGPIVISHDGRVSSSVFHPAVVAGVTATGRDALLAGSSSTPTVGVLVRELRASGGIQISASHNPPQYNGLKFFQPRGMVLSPGQGTSMLERWQRKDFAWRAGITSGAHARSPILTRFISNESSRPWTSKPSAVAGSWWPSMPATDRGDGWPPVSSAPWGVGRSSSVGSQTGGTIIFPEPTEKNLGTFSAVVPAVGAAVGFAQDPDADRLALVDETGRYIGEELTLALAARHRLGQSSRRGGPQSLHLEGDRRASSRTGLSRDPDSSWRDQRRGSDAGP